MKQTRLALALVTSLAATPVLAASMTMLQFGSFETRAEAEKRLSEITSKYGDSVGKLPTNIREVKLPPDNLTVYRTQAGPVADRAAAQGICSKLASTGDECYIVQTAMVNAPSTPAVASAAAPVSSPIAAELEKAKTDAVASTGATPDLTSKLSTLNNDVAARDASSRAAINSINPSRITPIEQPTADTATIAPLPAGEPSPEMKAALDKAVAEQPKVAADLNATTAAADTAPARRSFWSRMNPFSSSAPAAAPVVAAAPAPTAAPVEPVTAQAIEAPAPVVVASTAAAPAVETAPVIVAQPAITSQPAAPVNAQPAAGFDNTPVVTQAAPLRLPPPPAPLKAQDREALAAGKAPNAAPEVVAQPIISPLPSAAPSATGTVQVEEAKRVPVTTTNEQPAILVNPAQAVPVTAAPFQQQPVSLRPSSTEGRKTIWAQIGPFATKDAALTYWNNYRQNQPDFPVVRVRVTSSFQQELHGTGQAWLRIGPVAQAGFVRSLCASLTPTQPQTPALRCGMVADLGISSPIRPTTNGLLPTSRYQKR